VNTGLRLRVRPAGHDRWRESRCGEPEVRDRIELYEPLGERARCGRPSEL